MTTHRLNNRESVTVADFGALRAAPAVPSVSVRLHRSGRWTVVEVDGEMDVQTLPLVVDALGSDTTHVLFELRGVTFLDASGLGMMIGSQRTARAAGGCVRLVAPSQQARRLLWLTGTDRVFLTFDSLDKAVAAPVAVGRGPAA